MSFTSEESQTILSRLYRDGRPIDPIFDNSEKLYRRFCHDEVIDGRYSPSRIKPPGSSLNRGLYSEPRDVLFPNNPCCGIAIFVVEDVSSIEVKSGNGVDVFSFGLSHKPEEYNYSHSEIIVFKNKKILLSRSFSSVALKSFQNILSNRTKTFLNPDQNNCVKKAE